MKKKFKDITRIDTPELFEQVSEYVEELIAEATQKGALSVQGERNEYTLEISRVGGMCADYEALYYEPKCLKFKSPLSLSYYCFFDSTANGVSSLNVSGSCEAT